MTAESFRNVKRIPTKKAISHHNLKLSYYFPIGQSTIQCTITCRGDDSCQAQLIASEFRYPGEVRQGSCDKSGQCSQDYTVHCQKCFDYCQRQGPGQYDTAVITLAFNPNKPDENVNKRPDPGNNN